MMSSRIFECVNLIFSKFNKKNIFCFLFLWYSISLCFCCCKRNDGSIPNQDVNDNNSDNQEDGNSQEDTDDKSKKDMDDNGDKDKKDDNVVNNNEESNKNEENDDDKSEDENIAEEKIVVEDVKEEKEEEKNEKEQQQDKEEKEQFESVKGIIDQKFLCFVENKDEVLNGEDKDIVSSIVAFCKKNGNVNKDQKIDKKDKKEWKDKIVIKVRNIGDGTGKSFTYYIVFDKNKAFESCSDNSKISVSFDGESVKCIRAGNFCFGVKDNKDKGLNDKNLFYLREGKGKIFVKDVKGGLFGMSNKIEFTREFYNRILKSLKNNLIKSENLKGFVKVVGKESKEKSSDLSISCCFDFNAKVDDEIGNGVLKQEKIKSKCKLVCEKKK